MPPCQTCPPPERLFRIHPAIGVARVGNSKTGFFIGPEKPGVTFSPDLASDDPDLKGIRGISKRNKYKDSAGKVKRQAARFRVYEYRRQKDGTYKSVGEVTASRARLTWTVNVANKKPSAHADLVRHIGGPGARRPEYEIKPMKATVADAKASRVQIFGESTNNPLAERTGKNKGKVYLGEILTDAAGRLIFLGGRGLAGGKKDELYGGFHNPWSDDISDGPVKVAIRFHGDSEDIPEEDIWNAWVIVGPPDFAPNMMNVTTLYDRLLDIARRGRPEPLSEEDERFIIYKNHKIEKDHKTSFVLDIEPMFKRTLAIEWTFRNAWKRHPKLHKLRYNTALDNTHLKEIRSNLRDRVTKAAEAVLNDEKNADKLNADDIDDLLLQELDKTVKAPLTPEDIAPYVTGFQWRSYVFQTVCPPKESPRSVGTVPSVEDDPKRIDAFRYTMPALEGDPKDRPAVTATQHDHLRSWCIGLFVDTRRTRYSEDANHWSMGITPAGLDRAALDGCSGGAYFPGIEVSLAMLDRGVFFEPFRIDHDGKALGHPVGPGFFTQQMSLPWHTDFRDCTGPSEPPLEGNGGMVWWPAQRPVSVFTSVNEARAGDASGPTEIWARRKRGGEEIGNYRMAKKWSTLGFVVKRGSYYIERER
jgi:hypothetical protein